MGKFNKVKEEKVFFSEILCLCQKNCKHKNEIYFRSVFGSVVLLPPS